MRMSFSALFSNPQTWSSRLFCLMLFAFSWFFWGTVLFTGQSFNTFSGKLLVLAGLLGPMIIAVVLTRNASPEIKKDLLSRLIDLKRVPISAYAWLIGIPLLIMLASITISITFGGSLQQFVPRPHTTFSALSFFIFVMSTLFIGPLPEEIGWRGFMLHRLTESIGSRRATIAVAATYAIWILPLFFIRAHPLHAAASTWLFIPVSLVTVVAQAVAYTYVYTRFRQSIWATILLHFGIAFSFHFFEVEMKTQVLVMIGWILIAVKLITKL